MGSPCPHPPGVPRDAPLGHAEEALSPGEAASPSQQRHPQPHLCSGGGSLLGMAVKALPSPLLKAPLQATAPPPPELKASRPCPEPRGRRSLLQGALRGEVPHSHLQLRPGGWGEAAIHPCPEVFPCQRQSQSVASFFAL